MKRTKIKKLKKHKNHIIPLLIIALLVIVNTVIHAQSNGENDTAKVTNIELIHADVLEYDESSGVRAKKLIGNVHFLHDGTNMYCDSAYLFSDENNMWAYSNVRIDGSSGAKILGDSLRYNGNEKVARLRGNITLIDEDQTLTTNYMDFKLKDDLAYYLGGGVLINDKEKSTLTSEVGYYYTKRKEFFFKDSVLLIHPDYTINSDTLMHNTRSERTYFFGPTTIVSKGSNIYCEDGWYDAKADSSILKRNASIDNEGKLMYGDSIFYSRKAGIGEAFCNVLIIDTTENMEIHGDYAIHYEKDSLSIITGDNALLIQRYDDDTLYLHGDTLIAEYEAKPVSFQDDTLEIDSLGLGSESILNLSQDPILKKSSQQPVLDSIVDKKDTLSQRRNRIFNRLVPDSLRSLRADIDSTMQDSLNKSKEPSKYQIIRAYHKVKFLKNDMQGKCDSLIFSDLDSTIRMYTDPIIWSSENQMSGNFIKILTYDGEAKHFNIDGNSFIISEVDSLTRYNQIKGDKMIGHFKKGELRKVNVIGNGKSIYYAVEKKRKEVSDSLKITEKEYIGMNSVSGEDMDLYIEDNSVKKIVIKKPSPSTLYPLEELKKSDERLSAFKWRASERPREMIDIFDWKELNPIVIPDSLNSDSIPKINVGELLKMHKE